MEHFKNTVTGIIILGVISSLTAAFIWDHGIASIISLRAAREALRRKPPASAARKITGIIILGVISLLLTAFILDRAITTVISLTTPREALRRKPSTGAARDDFQVYKPSQEAGMQSGGVSSRDRGPGPTSHADSRGMSLGKDTLADSTTAQEGTPRPEERSWRTESERPSGFINEGDAVVPVAVFFVDETGNPAASLSEDVASALGGTAALFTREFVTSRLFFKVFEGTSAPLLDLKLDRRAAVIILGKVTTNASLDFLDESLKVVTVHCEANVYVARERFRYHHITAAERGADFAEPVARKKALSSVAALIIRQAKRFL